MNLTNSASLARCGRLIAPLVVLLVAAACSGGAPTSPSDGGHAGSPAAGDAAAGAVITGTVTGASSSPASVASNSVRPLEVSTVSAVSTTGLSVRVVGTDISTAVGNNGVFTLSGVPGGTVRLQFRNDSVDATTALTNVSGNQFIQIEVQVTGTSAVIVNEARDGKVTLCHAEGNGLYHSITVSESAEAGHRDHGDGKVGDAVPGRPNMTFDEDCRVSGPAIEIETLTNGDEADAPTGPEVIVGSPVRWEYRVSNTGTLNLTGIVVVDDRGVAVDCAGRTTLSPLTTLTCTAAGVAVLGQYRNVATVTANWARVASAGTVTASDPSHYLGVGPDTDEGPKVTLCHRTGNSRYVKVDVSVSAEPAHRAHGDAKVGEAVPDLPGKTFSAACAPQ